MPYGLMMRRGLFKRCPVCGSGKLFRHWVTMVEDCPRCGLHFHRASGQWLGSWFLNICVSQVVIIAVLVIGMAATYQDPPMGLIITITALTAVLVPFVFFPYARTIWTAVDLMVQPLSLDDGVAPGFELDLERETVQRRSRSHRPAGRPRA